MIILLDLNYTFVANSHQTFRPDRPAIHQEQYRDWLIPLFRAANAYVVMITVRDAALREDTLARIERVCGWLPHEAYFKPSHLRYTKAGDWKHKVVVEHLFPRFGRDREYLALESNPETRNRYRMLGISAKPVSDDWTSLPPSAPIQPFAQRRPTAPDTLVLLDLNYTLVENSKDTFDIARPNIAAELYRGWLVELLRPLAVLLITTRAAEHRAETLSRIAALCRWQPHGAFFKPANVRFVKAPIYKRTVLEELVWPRYGLDRPYLALESNAQTRAMYSALGVPSIAVPYNAVWLELPEGALVERR